MKSRYLILIPLILLAILLIPMMIVRNKTAKILSDSPKNPQNEQAQPPTSLQPEPAPAYTTAPASPDGIGKIFMGREIAQVMGHPGIGWLERTDREKEEGPSKAIALLDLAPDAIIADIGAGSGYYSFRIAPLIPKGKVIAVDIQQEMLDYLKTEAAKREITNVQPHLGTIDSIKLPENSIDAVLFVDAYHEFSHPAEMLQSIHTALKPGGKIYLLEFRAEDTRVPIKRLHKMSAAQATKEFEALGFTFVENKSDLPWQHFLVFKK
jgi:SAM-dependent methyltransferase